MRWQTGNFFEFCFRFNTFHIVHYHSETCSHINKASASCRSGLSIKYKTGRSFFSANTEWMNFDFCFSIGY